VGFIAKLSEAAKWSQLHRLNPIARVLKAVTDGVSEVYSRVGELNAQGVLSLRSDQRKTKVTDAFDRLKCILADREEDLL
jgi:hypothetical protein